METSSRLEFHYQNTTFGGMYRGLPSLEEYILVECHRHQPGGAWLWTELTGLQDSL